ncbi:MAG: heavy metal-binding domain-containing protein [Pirellulaceae bacterium]
MLIMSGLSGNEMYCLHLKGYAPGDLVLGNSVYSLGFLGNLGAGISSIIGGEVGQVTQVIHDGRVQAFNRMVQEAINHGGNGITSVTSDLKTFRGNVEFLSLGSCVSHREGGEGLQFSTSSDGQELYCQLDAGFEPLRFVFGNVAYSIGLGGGIIGGLKSIARGEIKEFSDVFNHTRHLALDRMVQEARSVNANAVVGIQTTVMPFRGIHEMMMTGTASFHPQLPAEYSQAPITSDLTCEEMWNMINMGYLPVKLVLGTAVYSLGIVGGVAAFLKSFSRGEVSELTSLIYEAREHAIGLIRDEASEIGADDVVGIKTHVHELGGLIEFMAIGTAVKRFEGIRTVTSTLPTQAVIRDKDTWISHEQGLFATVKSGKGADG